MKQFFDDCKGRVSTWASMSSPPLPPQAGYICGACFVHIVKLSKGERR